MTTLKCRLVCAGHDALMRAAAATSSAEDRGARGCAGASFATRGEEEAIDCVDMLKMFQEECGILGKGEWDDDQKTKGIQRPFIMHIGNSVTRSQHRVYLTSVPITRLTMVMEIRKRGHRSEDEAWLASTCQTGPSVG